VISFDTSDFLAGLDTRAEVMKECARPAAQAGIQVLYDEVKVRAPVSKQARVSKKGKVIKPGALRDSIYQVYSKDNSGEAKATFHCSWNAKKAPHGHLVEFGTSRAPAHPFLRPAFDAKRSEIAEAVRSTYVSLAAQRGVK
jgi:HK97 gp10 family phage protein